MEHINVHIRGLVPTIMHADTLANPLHPLARQMSAISGKRKKTDEDREAMAEIEFKAALYHDDELGPYWPDFNLFRCIKDAAKITKQGKDVDRGLGIAESMSKLLYDGPCEPDKLFADLRFVDTRSVLISGRRIMRTRPIFKDWELKFTVLYDTGIFSNSKEVSEIVHAAGRYVGLSDFRPRFGRFEVVTIH